MDIADNRINLTAQDIDFSVSANETISCSYEGQNITIGFKPTFLVEILSNIDSRLIVNRIGRIRPVRALSNSVLRRQAVERDLMLLMPMMINA